MRLFKWESVAFGGIYSHFYVVQMQIAGEELRKFVAAKTGRVFCHRWPYLMLMSLSFYSKIVGLLKKFNQEYHIIKFVFSDCFKKGKVKPIRKEVTVDCAREWS